MESFVPFVQNNLDSALWFRPELALTFGTLLLFVLDLFWKRSVARVAYLTAGALAVLGVAAALLSQQPSDGTPLFNGMIANDAFASFFKWLFLAAGALTVLIAAQGKDFPAARIGFLVVPPALERELVQFRRIVSHQNDPIVQDAIARWFASGGLERHLRRMRRHYEARRDAMVAALERARETVDLEWDTPDGGMALWLDTRRDARRIARAARAAGIFAVHEGTYRFEPGPVRHLRLGFSSLAPERLTRGIDALVEVLRDDVGRRSRPPGRVAVP